MVTYLPVASPFIRFAGSYVDEAFGVMVGYNFFVFEAALIVRLQNAALKCNEH